MKKRLYIMRHAKSDWSRSLADEQRPLNKRGERAARRMGRWMRDEGLHPSRIYSSTARRAEQTALILADCLNMAPERIRWDERLYLASSDSLWELLGRWLQETDAVMIVGHNPGLETLLGDLIPEGRLDGHGKRFPTAALAVVELPAEGVWRGRADLIRLQRPRDLGE